MAGILNRNLVALAGRPIKILQFGSSVRLLSTLDYMVQIANDECGANAGIAVVTNRAKDPLVRQDGRYTIRFTGENPYPGEPSSRIISSIERFYDPEDNPAELFRAAEEPDLRFIVSDAGKDGITLEEKDGEKAYPRVLAEFLYRRYDTFKTRKEGLLRVVAFEDVDHNAELLKAFTIRFAREEGMPEEFIRWVQDRIVFAGTRIFTAGRPATMEERKELENRRGYSDACYILSDYRYLILLDGIKPSSGILSHPLMHVEAVEPESKTGFIPRIDLHADTPVRADREGNSDLFLTDGQIDLKRLKESGAFLQDFAFCLTQGIDPDMDKVYAEFWRLRGIFARNEERYRSLFTVVRDKKTLQREFARRRLCALLSIEDAAMIDGKPERLQELFDAGIRLVTLTWNYENCMGFPHSEDPYRMNRGLKPFGIETVKRMNELGMIVDVSHLNDGGFWDVIRYTKKPVVASHSNVRSLRAVTRNLTDDMILAIASTGGVIGINFCPSFVSADETHTSVEDLVRHIEKIRDLAGVDCIALGSDFDGIPGEIEIADCTEFGKLEDALRAHGFTEEEIRKIWYGNAMRVLEKCLPEE